MDIQKWIAEAEACGPNYHPTIAEGPAVNNETQPPDGGRRGRAARRKHEGAPLASLDLAQPGRSSRKRKRDCPSADGSHQDAPSRSRSTEYRELKRADQRHAPAIGSSAATDGSSEPPTSSSASLSSRASAHKALAEPTYERRSRCKTRDNRYELQDGKQGTRRRPKTGTGRQYKARTKAARRGKTSAAIIHNFCASNVAQDRLTVGDQFPSYELTNTCPLATPL